MGELIQGFPITSDFADHVARGDPGIDLGTPLGTRIYAPFEGIVTHVGCGPKGCDESFGHQIVFTDPGGQLSLLFAHLSGSAVSEGRVAAGTLLGTTGESGNTTGPHLHFATLFMGKPIDPTAFLREVNIFSPQTNVDLNDTIWEGITGAVGDVVGGVTGVVGGVLGPILEPIGGFLVRTGTTVLFALVAIALLLLGAYMFFRPQAQGAIADAP